MGYKRNNEKKAVGLIGTVAKVRNYIADTITIIRVYCNLGIKMDRKDLYPFGRGIIHVEPCNFDCRTCGNNKCKDRKTK